MAYLGPEGTFTQEALLADTGPGAVEGVPAGTIYDAIIAVRDGRVDWAVVPIENSTEGSVSVTLDTLAREATEVRIVGELVRAVRQCLIAREQIAVADVETVVTHPNAAGQCAAFLRSELARARVLAASSTADAVRMVSETSEPYWAALGTALAAQLYGGVVLREGVEDRHDNETRFVWLAGPARAGERPPRLAGDVAAAMKTTLVFWGLGADGPGWLVGCLDEFARRAVNLTRIESRPRREQLGRYMFFVDLEGGLEDERVREAVTGLEGLCQEVRALGSYPVA